MGSWIGVDFDGTLVEYHGYDGVGTIGKPIDVMIERVKHWLALGIEVRIVIARVNHNSNVVDREIISIEKWCLKIFGVILPVTCSKDFEMIEFWKWDDRAVPISSNTGEIISDDELRRIKKYQHCFSYADSEEDLKAIKEDNK